ncbi:hypothetical protein K458DRAFT_36556 [Lentithecium fluviatile CBS 122367]|uniref:Uncharacterized protein n=1 Tax=Lentithecium fluviatile CBS 122367 TaxID=1168545 RepID=A0A6G1J1F3_9PLEO|nr:hypothetical protein K458DRAFT_36556 [Lentithecium fluviatile CBS 122367]
MKRKAHERVEVRGECREERNGGAVGFYSESAHKNFCASDKTPANKRRTGSSALPNTPPSPLPLRQPCRKCAFACPRSPPSFCLAVSPTRKTVTSTGIGREIPAQTIRVRFRSRRTKEGCETTLFAAINLRVELTAFQTPRPAIRGPWIMRTRTHCHVCAFDVGYGLTG